ncbi:hypothetical protein SCALM49S_05751 [Streptomyces californicus]
MPTAHLRAHPDSPPQTRSVPPPGRFRRRRHLSSPGRPSAGPEQAPTALRKPGAGPRRDGSTQAPPGRPPPGRPSSAPTPRPAQMLVPAVSTANASISRSSSAVSAAASRRLGAGRLRTHTRHPATEPERFRTHARQPPPLRSLSAFVRPPALHRRNDARAPLARPPVRPIPSAPPVPAPGEPKGACRRVIARPPGLLHTVSYAAAWLRTEQGIPLSGRRPVINQADVASKARHPAPLAREALCARRTVESPRPMRWPWSGPRPGARSRSVLSFRGVPRPFVALPDLVRGGTSFRGDHSKRRMSDRRTYVLDTSVLLADPAAMSRLDEHDSRAARSCVATELEAKRHHPELGYFGTRVDQELPAPATRPPVRTDCSSRSPTPRVVRRRRLADQPGLRDQTGASTTPTAATGPRAAPGTFWQANNWY